MHETAMLNSGGWEVQHYVAMIRAGMVATRRKKLHAGSAMGDCELSSNEILTRFPNDLCSFGIVQFLLQL